MERSRLVRIKYICLLALAACIIIGALIFRTVDKSRGAEFSNAEAYIFGSYEQDGDDGDGPEPIEWIVLKEEGSRITLISKYGLDTTPYTSTGYMNGPWWTYTLTWSESYMRYWLNDYFYSTAFSAEEQSAMCDFNTAETADMVSLLSSAEAKAYFPCDSARICFPTEYALSKGARVNELNGGGWWWLRCDSSRYTQASMVYSQGSVYYTGGLIYYEDCLVRPVIIIDTSLI